MKIFLAILISLIVLANIELLCFLKLGAQLGLLPTIAIILGTGALGAWLAKREIGKSWNNLKNAFMNGGDISYEMINGLALLLAAAALCIPGFITDIFGLLLLVAPLRRVFVRQIARHWKTIDVFSGFWHAGNASGFRVFHDGGQDSFQEDGDFGAPQGDPDVIDVEATSSSKEYH